jgi:hypothetical protein
VRLGSMYGDGGHEPQFRLARELSQD